MQGRAGQGRAGEAGQGKGSDWLGYGVGLGWAGGADQGGTLLV